jgi:hypothetical protein
MRSSDDAVDALFSTLRSSRTLRIAVLVAGAVYSLAVYHGTRDIVWAGLAIGLVLAYVSVWASNALAMSTDEALAPVNPMSAPEIAGQPSRRHNQPTYSSWSDIWSRIPWWNRLVIGYGIACALAAIYVSAEATPSADDWLEEQIGGVVSSVAVSGTVHGIEYFVTWAIAFFVALGSMFAAIGFTAVVIRIIESRRRRNRA